MTTAEKQKVLRNSELFAELPAESLAAALSAADERRFSPGEVLFSKDERRMGVIAMGSALAKKPGSSGPVTMSILGYGSVFGAASVLGGDVPETVAVALKPVSALVFTPESFGSLLDSDPALARSYMRYLIGRIRFLTERVECMAGGTASEKLLRYFETNSKGGVCHISFGMDALAKGISMSRATLYRAINELEESGRIARNGHEIRLL